MLEVNAVLDWSYLCAIMWFFGDSTYQHPDLVVICTGRVWDIPERAQSPRRSRRARDILHGTRSPRFSMRTWDFLNIRRSSDVEEQLRHSKMLLVQRINATFNKAASLNVHREVEALLGLLPRCTRAAWDIVQDSASECARRAEYILRTRYVICMREVWAIPRIRYQLEILGRAWEESVIRICVLKFSLWDSEYGSHHVTEKAAKHL